MVDSKDVLSYFVVNFIKKFQKLVHFKSLRLNQLFVSLNVKLLEMQHLYSFSKQLIRLREGCVLVAQSRYVPLEVVHVIKRSTGVVF